MYESYIEIKIQQYLSEAFMLNQEAEIAIRYHSIDLIVEETIAISTILTLDLIF